MTRRFLGFGIVCVLALVLFCGAAAGKSQR